MIFSSYFIVYVPSTQYSIVFNLFYFHNYLYNTFNIISAFALPVVNENIFIQKCSVSERKKNCINVHELKDVNIDGKIVGFEVKQKKKNIKQGLQTGTGCL